MLKNLSILALMASASVLAHTESHRIVFVTSVHGTADLGSWEDAGGNTGLAAADAICQARAAAGGLSNPEEFVAWISDSSDDAFCRIHGMTGKKSDNCGQGTLPMAAGPWLRTDGYPFAPHIENLLAPGNVVYTPPWRDEFGDPVSASRSTLTSTSSDGELISGRTCDDWTSTESSSGPVAGTSSGTSFRWTEGAGTFCGTTFLSLICMEPGPGPDLPEFIQSGRLAFVTSVAGTGNLASWPAATDGTSGLEAGDSICRNLASTAGLPQANDFKAFLSDENTDAINRFENDGPWVRPDGILVAANKAELTSELLFTAITVTETGDYLPPSRFFSVWTGTNPDGTSGNGHCDNWHTGSDASQGRRGSSNQANRLWTGGPAGNQPWGCDNNSALYCLSDLSLDIFNDRFQLLE
jgi:hypothetical protein